MLRLWVINRPLLKFYIGDFIHRVTHGFALIDIACL
uniref:Uncharacterized protein n=1 Tax=viral metagenome TaxID=1070528 RepID=A0A6C0C8K6_9ZZZZ